MISFETLALARKYTREYVDDHGGGGGGGGKEYVKYNTTAGWNAQRTLIAERGILYIYSDHSTITTHEGRTLPVPGIKVGDGNSYLIDLPFASDAEIKSIEDAVDMVADEVVRVAEQLDEHEADSDSHVTNEEKERWDRKVSVRFDEDNPETLVLF